MKITALAFVSSAALALAACGGETANVSTNSYNSLGSDPLSNIGDELGNSSVYDSTNTLGGSSLGGTGNSLGNGSSSSLGNTSAANVSTTNTLGNGLGNAQ